MVSSSPPPVMELELAMQMWNPGKQSIEHTTRARKRGPASWKHPLPTRGAAAAPYNPHASHTSQPAACCPEQSQRESPALGLARLAKQLEHLVPQEPQHLKDILQGVDPALQRERRKLGGGGGWGRCTWLLPAGAQGDNQSGHFLWHQKGTSWPPEQPQPAPRSEKALRAPALPWHSYPRRCHHLH